MATSADALYSLIKSFEDQFPIPAPYQTINVGTFDAASGKFTGLSTKVVTDPEPIEHLPNQHPVNPAPHFVGASYVSVTIDAQWHRTTTTIPAPKVPLAPVKLQFSVANATGNWSVTTNGHTTTAPANQTISISIWDAPSVSWTVQANGKSHQDRLMVQRPVGKMGLGVGAFTIPVLPISIIYAPPKDSLNKSTATYSQGQSVGTTITTSFGKDTTSTNPNQQTAYAAGADFSNLLNVTQQALSLMGQSFADAAKAVGVISSDFGKFTSTTTVDNSEATDDKLTLTDSTTDSFATSAVAGGPGTGDVMLFARGIKMAWVSTGDQLRLIPLGFATVEVPAGALKSNPAQSQLSATDVQFLLSFDPFATGGPDAEVPADRFQFQETLEYGDGTGFTHSFTQTRGSSTTTTDKNVTTDTGQWDAGPLFQLLGLGGKTTTTMSAGNATGHDVSNTVTASVNMASGPNDYFVVNIYYDTVFGTFAFQQQTPATVARVTGSGTGAGQAVTLVSGNKTFRTVTGHDGKFTFRARGIAPGAATLTIGNQPAKTVMVGPMTASASE